MLEFSQQQLDIFERDHRKALVAEFERSILKFGWEQQGSSKLRRALEGDILECQKVGFRDVDDMWWYVSLRYRISTHGLSLLETASLSKFLYQIDWDVSKRIEFIEAQIFSRKLSAT